MSGARRSYGCAYRVSEQHPGPLLPLNARGKASHRGAAALNSATARPAAHRPANRTRPSSLRGGAHFAAVCGGSTAQGSMHVSLRPLAERGGSCGPVHQCGRGDKAAIIAMFGYAVGLWVRLGSQVGVRL